MTDDELNALQDRHLDYGATLLEQGKTLARGPLTDQDDPRLRGISVWSVDRETARQLASQDPSVLAGRLEVQVMTWMLPAGSLLFGKVRAPHSVAEAHGD
jgi:hypothetical protein